MNELIRELQKIYDSEINFSITCFWDGGFTVKLGDDLNGFEWDGIYDNLQVGIERLIEKVKDIYPISDYTLGRIR